MRHQRVPVFVSAALLLSMLGRAQDPLVPASALVISSGSAQLLRARAELTISVKPGEVLFEGDSVTTGEHALILVSCAELKQKTFGPNSEIIFEAKQVSLKSGKLLKESAAQGCFLPPLPRSFAASEQHTGAWAALDRGDNPGTLGQHIAMMQESLRDAVSNELKPLGPEDGADPVSHLARAAVLEKYGLFYDAAQEMLHVTTAWPDAAWARSRLFILDAKGPAPRPAPEPEGQTYALLIGISSFKDPRISPLNFAHRDAMDLAAMLQSPRGGGVPKDNILLLTNEEATTDKIREAIETHLKVKATKNDTVMLFIASHGATIPVNEREKGFIITYNTTSEEPATSGIPMDDVRKLFEEELANVRRLYLYLDVCHAGRVGQIFPKPAVINKTTEKTLVANEVEMFGMLAAQNNQVAMESVIYGGGHGAFTYFLLRALNGDADFNKDNRVTMDEMAQFVQDKVNESTANHQLPKVVGDIDPMRVLAFAQLPGIQLPEYSGQAAPGKRSLPRILPTRPPSLPETVPEPNRSPTLSSRSLKYQQASVLLDQYASAIRAENISPTAYDGAFVYLSALKSRLDPDQYTEESAKLRVALEIRGQEILLRYLAGESSPQKREDFLDGQAYFEAALKLAPDSLYLQSRALFCEGRVAVFDAAADRNYAHARDLLERALRLDSDRAYSYNALGIAYLEQASYDSAIAAFREAIKRAPYWAYPQHNLALAYSQKGEETRAEETYRKAMRLAPDVAYLPFNLGLLLQRMNRPKEAESYFRQSLKLSPDNPQALNALGYLRASVGKDAEAERFYRSAIQKDPEFLAARHNLAVMFSKTDSKAAEAIALWREVLQKSPEYVPSRLSLARVLAHIGKKDEALIEYERVLETKPDYSVARVALADLYLDRGDAQLALNQLQQATKAQGESLEVMMRTGQAYVALHRWQDAKDIYQRAIKLAEDGSSRKVLKTRLAAMPVE
jgi:tetratricopeptide (TPR) repeat protein